MRMRVLLIILLLLPLQPLLQFQSLQLHLLPRRYLHFQFLRQSFLSRTPKSKPQSEKHTTLHTRPSRNPVFGRKRVLSLCDGTHYCGECCCA
ncbi:hypothetical protein BDQ17DRAFT_1100132 [Cyathus striatus]|nr:hypothetical protein BDQ17DRAFT_1100132 [Cyathus striatus]